MPRKKHQARTKARRVFTQEFKQDAVQMLLDGHATKSVSERLGVTSNLLYRWKSELIQDSGPAAGVLETRVRELEAELLSAAFGRNQIVLVLVLILVLVLVDRLSRTRRRTRTQTQQTQTQQTHNLRR